MKMEQVIALISAYDKIAVHDTIGRVVYKGNCGDFRATYDGPDKTAILESEVDRIRSEDSVTIILLK